MLNIFNRPYPIIILYAVALHLSWVACIFIDQSSYSGTALSAIYNWFGNATPYVCFSVAIAALAGIERRRRLFGLSLMLPQQALLMLSAMGAVEAIASGHFADGIERSRAFIAGDQLPAILAAIGHSIAILKVAIKRI